MINKTHLVVEPKKNDIGRCKILARSFSSLQFFFSFFLICFVYQFTLAAPSCKQLALDGTTSGEAAGYLVQNRHTSRLPVHQKVVLHKRSRKNGTKESRFCSVIDQQRTRLSVVSRTSESGCAAVQAVWAKTFPRSFRLRSRRARMNEQGQARRLFVQTV